MIHTHFRWITFDGYVYEITFFMNYFVSREPPLLRQ